MNKFKFELITLCFICLLPLSVRAKEVYRDKHQSWNLVDVVSDDNYTAICFDVKILHNRTGCLDAHKHDKQNSYVYISGNFGRLNLFDSEYIGDYKPWRMFEGYILPEYYMRGSKGKVARVIFYFPRIPIGTTKLNFFFYGGWADESAPSDRFECAKFNIKDILLTEDDDLDDLSTHWSEASLRNYWCKDGCKPMEGIYSFVSTSNPQYWGDSRHRIGLKYENGVYNIIYLSGSNKNIWKEGELKGVVSPTHTKGLYHVDKWYIDNKTLSPDDMYILWNAPYIILKNVQNGVKTKFVKLFPERDLEGIEY